MNLLDLGLDQDLNQGPYERVKRVVVKDITVAIIYERVTMTLKL